MADLESDPLFFEGDLDWQQVSPKLITERRIPVLAVALVGVVIVGLGVAFDAGRPVIIAIGTAALVAAAALWFWFVPRTATSWRYAEREQDLIVRHGRMIRHLTVVPYGRMQVIQVSSNPVATRLGIATVTLVTASADTDATIPGLPTSVAHELRDRLAAKGEALSAGL